MNILIGIEDKGLVLGPLITNRAPSAARQGCMISAREVNGSDGRLANVMVTGCEYDNEKEISTLCTVLADIIVENLQIRHMVRILKRSYHFLSEKDQCDVLVRVLKRLWYPAHSKVSDVAMCKNEIRKRLQSTIEEADADSIVLEGFMRFRMKDYLASWDKELINCVEEHIRKKEYAEFVEILRLFVRIRIPREKTVHVCVDGHGEYILLDEKLCLLSPQFLPGGIDKDDALLSALVNIAPHHIVVHNKDRFDDVRIIETIKDVFGKRVAFSEDMI